jgi:hypothetical protein
MMKDFRFHAMSGIDDRECERDFVFDDFRMLWHVLRRFLLLFVVCRGEVKLKFCRWKGENGLFGGLKID